eukprot:4626226-Alexandrium_andersonii.AAC.1
MENIGTTLVQQGIPVIHGRQLWGGLELANDGMHLRWELHTVFKVLYTLKTLANCVTLFCQFYGIPQRDPCSEATSTHLVRIDLGERWADYFAEIDDVIVDQTHHSFKFGQIVFRD